MGFLTGFPYTNFHELNLDWILQELKKIAEDEAAQNLSIEELNERLKPIEEWIDSFDSVIMKETVEKYLSESLARMIFVEISDSGYFIYYIPESWDTITFNTTGLDYITSAMPEYGHLVLSY